MLIQVHQCQFSFRKGHLLVQTDLFQASQLRFFNTVPCYIGTITSDLFISYLNIKFLKNTIIVSSSKEKATALVPLCVSIGLERVQTQQHA